MLHSRNSNISIVASIPGVEVGELNHLPSNSMNSSLSRRWVLEVDSRDGVGLCLDVIVPRDGVQLVRVTGDARHSRLYLGHLRESSEAHGKYPGVEEPFDQGRHSELFVMLCEKFRLY